MTSTNKVPREDTWSKKTDSKNILILLAFTLQQSQQEGVKYKVSQLEKAQPCINYLTHNKQTWVKLDAQQHVFILVTGVCSKKRFYQQTRFKKSRIIIQDVFIPHKWSVDTRLSW